MTDKLHHQPLAVRRALQLHEIPQEVLAAVHPYNRRTLHAAIRVNRAWADAGTTSLWHNPPTPALLQVKVARQPLSAAKICALLFDQDSSHPYDVVRHLAFPLLVSLSLGYGVHTASPGSSFAHFFCSSISRFRLIWVVRTSDLVQLLVTQCPQLANLSLSLWPATAVTASGASGNSLDLLIGLLSHCMALTSLSLYTSVYDGDLMTELVLHLATRSKLTQLYIAIMLSYSSIAAACSALHVPSAIPIAAVAGGLAINADRTETDHDLAIVNAASDNWFPNI
jgi:hypothetical protein